MSYTGITNEEIQLAVRGIKNKELPNFDCIVTEGLAICSVNVIKWLLRLLNLLLAVVPIERHCVAV